MERVLTIDARGGLFDRSSFCITENETLRITVKLAESRVGYYHLIVKHGKAKRLNYGFKPRRELIMELPPEWLNDGGVEDVEFSLVLRNGADTVTLKDDYKIEPLHVEKIEGNFSFSAAVTTLEKAFSEIVELVNGIDTRVKANEEKLKEFEDEGVPIFAEIDETEIEINETEGNNDEEK